ncbi:MAG TPA: hypothetical protein VN962_08000, partial [Polyangia bacterium]|nr:hypothetical protein [Polyangia bacterium]
DIDDRTDIYALGIILFEMLTGAPPFVSEGWGEVVLMHVTKPVPPPRQQNPDIPVELEAVILKALAKSPAERWTTMAELDTALRKAIGAPARGFVSGPPTVPAPLVPPGATMARPPTTLGASAGEVTPPTGIPETQRRAPWWRRPPLILAGGLAAAAVAVPLALTRHMPSAAIPAASSAAAPALPVAAPVVPPPIVAPAPVVAEPPRIEAPSPPREAPPPAVAASPPPHHKTSVRKREVAQPAKKAVAAPAPVPVTPAPSPPPARAKPAAEKW